jgi:hypothetical protein
MLTVRLPEYLVRALETAATDDATTVDDWLHHELVDFAGTVRRPGLRTDWFGREKWASSTHARSICPLMKCSMKLSKRFTA